MFANMPFNEDHTLIWKVRICLKDRMHRSCWNNFEIISLLGTSTVFRSCQNNLDTDSIGIHAAADHELRILQRMWPCWWSHVHSGRCATEHHSKILRNTGIRRSSVGRIIHDLFKVTHPRKTTCLFGRYVLSGSVAKQLGWSGKLCMLSQAGIIRILCTKNYHDRLKLL